MILQSTVKTEIGRQFFCVKFISAHLLYQLNHSLSLKDTWLFAFPCFFNKICQWIFYYNPEMFVELFWNSCQSCIKLNDLINSLSTRSFSQLLTFSLVNIGVVVLFRNYKKKLKLILYFIFIHNFLVANEFLNLHLKSSLLL